MEDLSGLQDALDHVLRSYPPLDGVFTELTMSTQTLSSSAQGPRIGHKVLIQKIIETGLDGGVAAVNCNYGSTCQPGYEHYIKAGGKPQQQAPMGRRNREPEGKGGCINSALEPVLIPIPGSDLAERILREGPPTKSGEPRVYKINFFPTTGYIQVSGSVLADGSDGAWAIQEWIRYLCDNNIMGAPITVQLPLDPDMANFKFRLRTPCERQILNLVNIEAFLRNLEGGEFPYRVNAASISPVFNSAKATFTFEGVGKKKPRVNMFLKGKINFLGFPSHEFAHQIYASLCRLLEKRWTEFVVLRPPTDKELKAGDVSEEDLLYAMRLCTQPLATRTVLDPEREAAVDECLRQLCEGPDGKDIVVQIDALVGEEFGGDLAEFLDAWMEDE